MNRSTMLTRRALSSVVLCVALAGMTACSLNEQIAESGKIDYKTANKLPSLDIPPDLVDPRGDDRFAIPQGEKERTLSGYQSARATERTAGGPSVLPAVPGIRMERDGAQRWLVVNQPPAKLWPLVRQFWLESGFTLESESPEAGIMETDWAENRAKLPQDIIRRTLGKIAEGLYSTGERDKFRTRLEPVAGGTEIYITHRGMVEVLVGSAKDQTRWTPRPEDPELEAEFLQRLVVKLGGTKDQAKHMLEATAKAPPSVARVVNTSERQLLELSQGFDHAWRLVGLALDRGGFTVVDRDRSKGDYYVRYVDPDAAGSSSKPGFFARLFRRSKSTPENSQDFRIKVTGKGNSTQVTVLAKDGKPLATDVDRRTAARILGLLRDQLQQ